MGGTSKSSQTTQQQTSQTQNPWDPAMPGLKTVANAANGLAGQAGQLSSLQSGALDSMQANASQGNPFAGQLMQNAQDMIQGGTDRTGMAQAGYDQYKQQLTPFANGDFLDPSKNAQLQSYLDIAGNKARDMVNAQFAGTGRSMSGANNIELARGVTEAMAPTLLNAYQGERTNQMNAINGLYGGANQTTGILSGLDQTKLGNQQAGIGVADAALGARDSGAQRTLQIEAQRLGIPVEQLSQIAGILGPIGSMGGTSNGTMNGQTQGSYTMSPVQVAQGWTNVAANAGKAASGIGSGLGTLGSWFTA